MDSCWSKGILVILAIMFFPITITIFIFKSDFGIKAKLIATLLLWGGMFIASKFLPEKGINILKENSTIVSESSNERSMPSNDRALYEHEDESDYASDRIVKENHPKLFDSVSAAKEFWAADLSNDAIVIRDYEHYNQKYPDAYLIIDGFKEENGNAVNSNIISSIHIPNYNCKDIPRFIMSDAIEIARSYLPITILTEKYELQESAYENMWADDYVGDETKKPQIQYDYYTNYKLKEESDDYPVCISIHLYTDRYGIVVDTDILPEYYQPKGEVSNWGYDYIQNNSTYETGIIGDEIYVDNELGISYQRPSGTPALSRGSKGGAVGWLQAALNKAMHAGINESCMFDDETDSAVREFQSRCGMGADGVAGPKTIATLVEIVSGKRSMPEKIVTTDSPRVVTTPPITEKPTIINTQPPKQQTSGNYVLNTSSKKIHTTTCRDLPKIKEENRKDYTGSIEDLKSQGYTRCGHCHPK